MILVTLPEATANLTLTLGLPRTAEKLLVEPTSVQVRLTAPGGRNVEVLMDERAFDAAPFGDRERVRESAGKLAAAAREKASELQATDAEFAFALRMAKAGGR